MTSKGMKYEAFHCKCINVIELLILTGGLMEVEKEMERLVGN